MRYASLFFALAVGCSSSKSTITIPKTDLGHATSLDSGTPGDLSTTDFDLASSAVDFSSVDQAIVPGANVVPLTVDGFEQTNDVSFISVTICAPGTTTCQTIDHINVDTGSVGLRILSTSINSSLRSALPVETVNGKNLSECYIYGEGYVFGSVRTADISIGGEALSASPFEVIGDLGSAPSDCAQNGGQNVGTLSAFRTKGILGVHPSTPDCGSDCGTAANQPNPFYYGCTGSTGSTCTAIGVPDNQQVPNPYVGFPVDNNGVIINLPAVPDDTGADTPTGTLVFGINTQSNNQIGGATVYAAIEDGGLEVLTGKIGSQTFMDTVFDSGTSTIAFDLTSNPITTCGNGGGNYYCPTTTKSFTLGLTDANGQTGSFGFSIANAEDLLQNNSTAFDDLGTTGIDGLMLMGLPTFYGRKIFIGSNITGTPGAFYAF